MELSNNYKIIWESEERLSEDDILNIFKSYLGGAEFRLLNKYDDYYEK